MTDNGRPSDVRRSVSSRLIEVAGWVTAVGALFWGVSVGNPFLVVGGVMVAVSLVSWFKSRRTVNRPTPEVTQ